MHNYQFWNFFKWCMNLTQSDTFSESTWYVLETFCKWYVLETTAKLNHWVKSTYFFFFSVGDEDYSIQTMKFTVPRLWRLQYPGDEDYSTQALKFTGPMRWRFTTMQALKFTVSGCWSLTHRQSLPLCWQEQASRSSNKKIMSISQKEKLQ